MDLTFLGVLGFNTGGKGQGCEIGCSIMGRSHM
jgi:hypothetical protein